MDGPYLCISSSAGMLNRSVDQDAYLDQLSHSINRQRDLSMQINDEIDVHHGLLQELDTELDRTDARMSGARRKLDRFARSARNNSMCVCCLDIYSMFLVSLRFHSSHRRTHSPAADINYHIQDMIMVDTHHATCLRFGFRSPMLYRTLHFLRFLSRFYCLLRCTSTYRLQFCPWFTLYCYSSSSFFYRPLKFCRLYSGIRCIYTSPLIRFATLPTAMQTTSAFTSGSSDHN